MSARIYSYWGSDQRQGFADYARFLSFGLLSPHLVYSYTGFSSHSRASLAREVPRLVSAAAVSGATLLIAVVLLQSRTETDVWFAKYLTALAAFVVIASAVGVACGSVWRMMGIRARPLVDKIWLSRTPAEFWRRWSWPPHQWLNRYVFVPWGGRVHPVAATVVVFLVSGLAHELMAGVGLGRLTGHQTAFFLVSSLGVMASPHLERLARWGLAGEIVMRLATIIFMITTATLMFATFNKFVPLYQEPAWLDW
jgi:D-alanyl-lipoteichoic acid acyltransferase DltB (MBOAT superfamily)